MTEEDARDLIASRVAPDALDRLDHFTAMLLAEADQQNLISRTTLDAIWKRHILDSAQLAWMAPPEGRWIDVGTGAGLPGVVVAIMRDQPTILIEPRRLRVEFLEQCCRSLDLGNVSVIHAKAENAKSPHARVISARAVAKAGALFRSAGHLANRETIWLLPKGRSAQSEVAEARRSWQGVFHVEQSIVDDTSGIIVAQGVAKR